MTGVDPLCLALRDIRLERGLSLRAVGRPIGLSASHLCGYETGRANPSLGTLRAWVDILGHDLTISPLTTKPVEIQGATS